MNRWKPTVKKLEAEPLAAEVVKDERELLRKGRALFRESRHPEASAVFEDALKAYPKSVGARLGLGLVLLRQRRGEEALKQFVEARTLDPLQPKAYVLEGQALINQGQFDQAILTFQNALNLDPKSVKALVGLGQALVRQARYSEAQRFLQTALSYNPSKVLPRLLLAEIHLEQGQEATAMAELRLALDIDPGHVRAAMQLARLLIAATHRLDAEQVLQGTFAQVAEEESSLVQLGRAALEMEFYPLAEAALLGALRLNPGRTAIRLSVVEALLANGKLQEAEAQVQELPQSGQTASLVHKLLGDIHLQRKQFRLAVEEYRATVLHLPDNEQLLAELNQELAAGVEAADWEDLAESLQPSVADRVAGETERMSQHRKQRRERR